MPDDDDIHDLIFSNIDNLREMGHVIVEPDDNNLEHIWADIYSEEYVDENDLEDYIIDLIFKYLCIK